MRDGGPRVQFSYLCDEILTFPFRNIIVVKMKYDDSGKFHTHSNPTQTVGMSPKNKEPQTPHAVAGGAGAVSKRGSCCGGG